MIADMIGSGLSAEMEEDGSLAVDLDPFCIPAAEPSQRGDVQYKLFEALAVYFLEELPAARPSVRRSLECHIASALASVEEADNGIGRGTVRESRNMRREMDKLVAVSGVVETRGV
jgi:hypothetical protein